MPPTGPNQWETTCPACGKEKHLAVSQGENGLVLVHCHRNGCSYADIANAIGLPPAALFGSPAIARLSADHERALFRHLGETPPDPLPGWTYTQWEYRLAGRFNQRMMVYLAPRGWPRDVFFASGVPCTIAKMSDFLGHRRPRLES